MSILDDISGAAYDIMAGRVGDGFLPVAKNFNIAANHNHPIRNSRFDVYSYVTRVAVVNKNENGDWDALYRACNKACDDETKGEQFINVSQFTY